jgi:mannose-6-phosphate isomerase-like protein (cupin superfamily)
MGSYGQAAGCGLAPAGRRQTPRIILLEPLNSQESIFMSTEQTSYRQEFMGAAPPASETVVRPKDEGEARWFFGMLATFKTTKAQTSGLLTTLEVLAGPGAASPVHIHHDDDEGFLILEGEVTFEVGDAVVTAGPGDFLLGPREVPHRFVVGPNGARMFWTLTPGGFEEFVRAASVPAEARTLPPPLEIDAEGFAEIQRIGAAHRITIYPMAEAA